MRSSVWPNRMFSFLCGVCFAVVIASEARSDDSWLRMQTDSRRWDGSVEMVDPIASGDFSLIDAEAVVSLENQCREGSTQPVSTVAFKCDSVTPFSCGGCDSYCCDCYDPRQASYRYGRDSDADLNWINGLRVGYDRGFLIASQHARNLRASDYPFQLRFNGWGQLRHTVLKSTGVANDQNQFQLKRGRLIFSGVAFNPDFHFLIQLDGRSSSGDDVRLLDYYVSYDVGHANLGLRRGQFGLRTGKYKMPFTLARWLSGKELEFTDRSLARSPAHFLM
jgi:hypothetical protein